MNHTVLVVEDEEDLREMMRDALELKGYTVVAARDGQEALEKLSLIKEVCVVLLDLVMPRMNGWDFFAQLRQLSNFADVPVIVHCSSSKQTPPAATRVLLKPLEFSQLLNVVHEYCDVR
jgi:CheY-like chemotaxis protein